MRTFVFAIAMLVGLQPALSIERDFSSHVGLLKWIDNYRLEREFSRVPDAVRAMGALGLFTGQDKAAFYIGFMAGVLGDNQLKAEGLIGQMFPMAPERQAVIIKAIAFSGLPDWKGLLAKFAERMPLRKMLINKYLHHDGKTLMALPLNAEPNLLDSLWGYYFATGYYEPVLRIIATLAWSNEDKDLEKLTIGSMAAWTLASNAARNQDLLDLYHVQQPRLPQPIAGPLKDIIEAVEYFDSEKIRRNALSTIEEFKRRSLAPKPTWSQWASQAGSTVLALGCVAASATGYPELGASCVIAGALYTGTSKLIQSYPK